MRVSWDGQKVLQCNKKLTVPQCRELWATVFQSHSLELIRVLQRLHSQCSCTTCPRLTLNEKANPSVLFVQIVPCPSHLLPHHGRDYSNHVTTSHRAGTWGRRFKTRHHVRSSTVACAVNPLLNREELLLEGCRSSLVDLYIQSYASDTWECSCVKP